MLAGGSAWAPGGPASRFWARSSSRRRPRPRGLPCVASQYNSPSSPAARPVQRLVYQGVMAYLGE
jgi:hypothetical protein